MKSICVFAAVLVFVGAAFSEKRSDFGVFGGQLESGFLPIVGHHDDQFIKSFSVSKKVPLPYQLNFEKKPTLDKPHHVYFSRPHQTCNEKKTPHPITIEKQVLVPVKIPILKPYPIYLEKKVPYQVEKKIPYFVYRHYPLHMEKPQTYNLKDESQFTLPLEKPSPLPQINHVPHHTDAASTIHSSYQFKVPQEGLYTGEGHKTQALQEGYDGNEYFFGDFFGKGLQQEASSGGNIVDQIGKQLGARELSTSNKQIYI